MPVAVTAIRGANAGDTDQAALASALRDLQAQRAALLRVDERDALAALKRKMGVEPSQSGAGDDGDGDDAGGFGQLVGALVAAAGRKRGNGDN